MGGGIITSYPVTEGGLKICHIFSFVIGLMQMSVFPQNLCIKTMSSNMVAFADLERLLSHVYGAFMSGISAGKSTVGNTIYELNSYPSTSYPSASQSESKQGAT